MADAHHGVNIATGVEISLQLHPHRISGGNQVIQDAVGDLFMGDRLIAVAVDVELDRLELHHPGSGLVDQPQHGEIGITGEGALAGEFRQLDRHLKGATRPGVVETDQLGFSDGSFAVEGGLSQGVRETQFARKTRKSSVGSVL